MEREVITVEQKLICAPHRSVRIAAERNDGIETLERLKGRNQDKLTKLFMNNKGKYLRSIWIVWKNILG